MGLLTQLREQGLRVGVEGGRLVVGPTAALTDAVRSTIRINRGAIVRELSAEAAGHHEAMVAARDAAGLSDFKHALHSGALVVCGNCDHFTFGADPSRPGNCNRFQVEAAPFLPFPCGSFDSSKEPVAPAFIAR